MNSNQNKHNHTSEINSIKLLFFSFILTAFFMLIEFIGGFISKSLALVSDAGHMLSDVASLGISIWAIYLGNRKANLSKTFGYKRIETIAAFVNGITLVVISILIFKEGIERLIHPVSINQEQLLVIAIIGLLINIVVATILFKSSKESVNVKSAFFHVISDLLGSVGAIIAGLIIQFTGWLYADSLISIFIAVLILFSAKSILEETFHTLMEGVPKNININDLVNRIKVIENIIDIHDLHIWSLSDSQIILTAHLVTNEHLNNQETIGKVKEFLHNEFNIEHSTIEIETINCNNCCNF